MGPEDTGCFWWVYCAVGRSGPSLIINYDNGQTLMNGKCPRSRAGARPWARPYLFSGFCAGELLALEPPADVVDLWRIGFFVSGPADGVRNAVRQTGEQAGLSSGKRNRAQLSSGST